MRKQVIMIALSWLFVGILVFTGCSSNGIITSSGPVVSRDYDLSDFTGVSVSSAFEFELVPANTFSVSITANEDLFPYIDVNKSGSTLNIGLKKLPINIGNTTLQASVSLPELVKLEVSGASQGQANGFVTADDFTLNVSGASTLDIDLSAGALSGNISGASQVRGNLMSPEINLELSGASQLELEGTAENSVMYVSGASNAALTNYPIRNGYFNLSGASRALVNVSNKLDADLSGASTLEYIGSPTLGEINIADACRIGRR